LIDKCDSSAALACAPSTADAVVVVIDVFGHIMVDNQMNIR